MLEVYLCLEDVAHPKNRHFQRSRTGGFVKVTLEIPSPNAFNLSENTKIQASKFLRLFLMSRKRHGIRWKMRFVTPHCLKITQNVTFEFFNFGIFTNFCPIKIDLSGNTV